MNDSTPHFKKSHSSRPILILDFGSQYTQLIARRVRGLGFYSELVPGTVSLAEVKAIRPATIILSGGPESIYSSRAPSFDRDILKLDVPILGICYGMCLLVRELGGKITGGDVGEYGRARIRKSSKSSGSGSRRSSRKSLLYDGTPTSFHVWMSHGDSIASLPDDVSVTATSEEKRKSLVASFELPAKKFYGLQYHPEVVHSEHGEKILNNFLTRIAGLKPTWSMPGFLETTGRALRAQVGKKSIIAAVSGGVDSTVMAVVLARFFKKQLRLVFIDNGLLRHGEVEEVRAMYAGLGLNLEVVDASKKFLTGLRGVRAPEEKRKIIGRTFVKVFFDYAKPLEMLAQGTLYPDVIESVSTGGPSHTIKTHHNRVKEILTLMKAGRVVEPFKQLFKDEVRELGSVLKIPASVLGRHPFPGPGLAVRILGAVNAKRLAMLRAADTILQEELRRAGLLEKTWQTFAVLLPVRSVGVVGDQRHYGSTVVIRSVTSRDGMTADFFLPSKKFLSRLSGRITGEVAGITRVVLDISSKPPATIEWE